MTKTLEENFNLDNNILNKVQIRKLIDKAVDVIAQDNISQNKNYHSLEHTQKVVQRTKLLIDQCLIKVNNEEKILTLISALYHDVIQELEEQNIHKQININQKIENYSIIQRKRTKNEQNSAKLLINELEKIGIEKRYQDFVEGLINSTTPNFVSDYKIDTNKYPAIIYPQAKTPIQKILCTADIGTLFFEPQDLIKDAFSLLREENLYLPLIAVYNNQTNISQLKPSQQQTIFMFIINTIRFQIPLCITQQNILTESLTGVINDKYLEKMIKNSYLAKKQVQDILDKHSIFSIESLQDLTNNYLKK